MHSEEMVEHTTVHMYMRIRMYCSIYVIVIVRLVCDMAQTQHEAQGREAPKGECCV